jgi:UDP-N-acetylmuramoyl-L-alanyl-D-glutamate--2,6-diaminopimelate ligase
MKNLFRKILPGFVFDCYHWLFSLLGALIFFFPSRRIKVIGVTGTNGKTTTVNMISSVLEEAGYDTAFLSSISFQIKKKEWPNLFKMTMPGRLEIQKFLRKAVKSNCQYAILEVSSEGIKQFRHLFIDFETVVFTNLSPEHIESHKGFENYKKAKGQLFQVTQKNHVINTDDDNSQYFLDFPSNKKTGYGIKSGEIKAQEIEKLPDRTFFKVNDVPFEINLLGEFNVYNALAAISVGLVQGINLNVSQKALKKFETVPGRMEQIIIPPYKVIVDYAVTPDALEKLYQTIKETFPESKIIAVLGSCGGGRDKWKRPILGEIAEKYCSKVFVTNEDPYDEDPMEIINQVAGTTKAVKILDRRQAINQALRTAQKKDIVVVTGKGCEPWMCVSNNRKIAWDDRETVREEINKILEDEKA